MSVRTQHIDKLDYFATFTCYNWLHLFDITDSYDMVYSWFEHMKTNNKAEIMAFVIMPNHVHVILHLNDFNIDLNKLLGNGKRFMAYELIKRLEIQGQHQILQHLEEGVSYLDRKKGQKHRAFESSFDAKPLKTIEFFHQKLNYIHYNPVKGKWKLAENFTDYEHSSASFYELNIEKRFRPFDYRDIWISEFRTWHSLRVPRRRP